MVLAEENMKPSSHKILASYTHASPVASSCVMKSVENLKRGDWLYLRFYICRFSMSSLSMTFLQLVSCFYLCWNQLVD
jgi:hypothetical protein